MSIVDQVNVDVSVIACDDGSYDSTVEMLELTAEKREHFKVLCNNSGNALRVAKNFFRGLRAALVEFPDCDYFALCDQDDIWFPEKLSRGVAALVEGNAVGYSSAVQCFGNSNRIVRQSSKRRPFDMFFEGAGQRCTFIIRRELGDAIAENQSIHDLLDSGFPYHDWLIYFYARLQNLTWIFDDKPSMLYRQHGANHTGVAFSVRGVIYRVHKLLNGEYSEWVSILASSELTADPEVIKFRDLLRQQKSMSRTMAILKLSRFTLRRSRRGSLILLLLLVSKRL